MTASAKMIERMPELTELGRPANERARLCGKIERYRMLLLQFRNDGKTVRALRAEIADLEGQLVSSKST